MEIVNELDLLTLLLSLVCLHKYLFISIISYKEGFGNDFHSLAPILCSIPSIYLPTLFSFGCFLTEGVGKSREVDTGTLSSGLAFGWCY